MTMPMTIMNRSTMRSRTRWQLAAGLVYRELCRTVPRVLSDRTRHFTRQPADVEPAVALRSVPAWAPATALGPSFALAPALPATFPAHRNCSNHSRSSRRVVAADMAAELRAHHRTPYTCSDPTPGGSDIRPRCRTQSTGRTNRADCSNRWPTQRWPMPTRSRPRTSEIKSCAAAFWRSWRGLDSVR